MVIGDRQLDIQQAAQGFPNRRTADLQLGCQLGFH
jgi:hypothetical protein